MKRKLSALLLSLLLLSAACRGSGETDETSAPYASFPIGGDCTTCSVGDRVYSLYYSSFHIYDVKW